MVKVDSSAVWVENTGLVYSAKTATRPWPALCAFAAHMRMRMLSRQMSCNTWLKKLEWSDRLYQTYEAVQSRQLVRRAADSYSVPKSTIYDWLKGRVPCGTKCGPPRCVIDPEELVHVNVLSGCAALGFACSKRDVTALVQKVVARKGMKWALIGNRWVWTEHQNI